MNAQQWETLVAAVRGEDLHPLPTAFIVDSPWMPNWAGHTILDYYADDRVFMEANFAAIRAFPNTLMVPGFWSEFGMCTEPSAFGSLPVWGEDEFPFAKPVVRSVAEIDRIEQPDPRKHGLLPFVIKRLSRLQPEMEAAGHRVRFAVTRGPFNVASFLMGTTEFLSAIKTDPDAVHRLLSVITAFLVDWIAWQRECFPSIDALLVLDDIAGFVSKRDFEAFGLPYFTRTFDADVTVKLFHNDSSCRACAPYLAGMGVNLLNFGVQHTATELRSWAGESVALMGNIPPRDVLAAGTPDDVARATRALLDEVQGQRRILVSCAGGMPPGVPTRNIQALVDAVAAHEAQAGAEQAHARQAHAPAHL
jgi:uroporphyrinogen decarboxylase